MVDTLSATELKVVALAAPLTSNMNELLIDLTLRPVFRLGPTRILFPRRFQTSRILAGRNGAS